MLDIDFLLDMAEATALLASGRRPSAPNGNGQALAVAARKVPRYRERPRRWTPEEDAFLQEALGRLSTEEIAAALGRSETAIKIRWTRKGYAAPSKQPDELTGNQIAAALGVDVHSVTALIDRGLMPGRTLPGSARNIRLVKRVTFYRWATNPLNWPYFLQCVDTEARVNGTANGPGRGTWRIGDPHLRRLVERQKERWDDRWLTTGQVAEMLGRTVSAINHYCNAGKVEGAVRWQNWYIRESVARQMHIPARGGATTVRWSEEADRFLVLATAVGLKPPCVGALVGGRFGGSLSSRLNLLRRDGRLPVIAAALNAVAPAGGEVLAGEETGRLWADWRPWRARFPGIDRAARLFVAGRELALRDRYYVLGVMAAWLRRFRPEEAGLSHLLRHSNAALTPVLRERYADLRALGIDPFQEDTSC